MARSHAWRGHRSAARVHGGSFGMRRGPVGEDVANGRKAVGGMLWWWVNVALSTTVRRNMADRRFGIVTASKAAAERS